MDRTRRAVWSWISLRRRRYSELWVSSLRCTGIVPQFRVPGNLATVTSVVGSCDEPELGDGCPGQLEDLRPGGPLPAQHHRPVGATFPRAVLGHARIRWPRAKARD